MPNKIDLDYRAVSPFAHEPYAFQMIMCRRCGALVFDTEAHNRSHASPGASSTEES